MVLCQSDFKKFHNKIRLLEENEVLRERRQEVMDLIKEKVDKSPTPFNQGSYAMHTGIKPLKGGDYDIDIGLYFDISKEDYEPLEVKEWVFDALKNQGESVAIKKPCVTVEYSDGYHIDVAVYANNNDDGKTYLARGKRYSSETEKVWFESNPKELIQKITEYSPDSGDREQFRRVVRYLKRWKDLTFKSVNGKPSGIALTCGAEKWLSPQKDVTYLPDGNSSTSYRDLDALIYLVNSMIINFLPEARNLEGYIVTVYRLRIELPVAPNSNLLEKMTDIQMDNFKQKLEYLLTCLNDAKEEEDPVEAAEILNGVFGEDFIVPDKKQTSAKTEYNSLTHNAQSSKE
ncbi:nucleotidyltransferase [Terribacillus saccharophilus]|uniref:nucleotidyltransferase domain-containing protein n=1 Tax=Terribacillus saccharophilus TaxID=361277 RepID=UPI003982C38B